MPKSILLIDDDPLVSRSLAKVLHRKGYKTEVANNAIEALTLVAVQDFDLVVSDIRMPGDNGIIAVEKIKKIYQERTVYCGYILISGYAEEDTPAHAIRLGVDKFLYKPIENEIFLQHVAEELELVEKEKQLKTAPQRAPVATRKARKVVAETRRAVITGIGVIAPSGIGKEAFWKGLKEGSNCVDQITCFDVSKFPSKMAAEIHDFNPSEFITEPNEIKRMSRSAHLAVAAAKLALEDAHIGSTAVSQLSIIMGSSTSGVEYLLPEAYAFEREGLNKVRPYVGIAGFVGSISSEVSRFVGARGLSHTISTGCTSSTDAIGYALRQIQYGFCDAVVTGGADACITDGILAAFCRMGAVSTRNHDCKKASRPFNKDRDGFVIGEGSWLFLLEELEHALKRRARIYGEVLGYGATCDAWHMSKPHPSGEQSSLAVQLALEDAGVEPAQVNLFETYGNSTPTNDSYETGVIKRVFGSHARQLVAPSIKSMLGHPIGAAGAGQVAAALLALNEGFVHPTINYEVPDPECDLDYVPNQGRNGKFEVAVCNSLAFGGKNAALIVKKFKE